jgi:hypothetical protein
MNVRFLALWLALGLFTAGGCAEGPKVVTNLDPSVEFSAFHTFAFSGITDRGHEIGPSDHSPLRERIKGMVDEQLTAKGVRQVSLEERPDLLVHLFYGVMDKDRSERTDIVPGYFGPRQVTMYDYQDGAWVKRSGVATYEDHEGALIVDLAEASKKQLVMRAVIRAVLGDNLKKNFELAHQGIAKAFEVYPAAK